MTGSPLHRLQELAASITWLLISALASDEGGEFGGRPVRVQSNMADTLVERLTGQNRAADVDI
jgi:hypothetical protein